VGSRSLYGSQPLTMLQGSWAIASANLRTIQHCTERVKAAQRGALIYDVVACEASPVIRWIH